MSSSVLSKEKNLFAQSASQFVYGRPTYSADDLNAQSCDFSYTSRKLLILVRLWSGLQKTFMTMISLEPLFGAQTHPLFDEAKGFVDD